MHAHRLQGAQTDEWSRSRLGSYELEKNYKFLSSATEVIVSGTSAGGMSTYMQSSYMKSLLTAPNAKLVAVPDAGFWWDTLQYGSDTARPWLDSMTKSIVPGVWNATLRGNNARCLSNPPDGNLAKCYAQPYLLRPKLNEQRCLVE